MPSNSSYFEEQRKLLEQEKFNKSIALANAEANAVRNTQASLQAQGFAGTGYGASAYTNTTNAYLGAQANLDNDYFASLSDLNRQEYEQNQADASSFLNTNLDLANQNGNLDPLIRNGLISNNNGQYAINENSNYIMNLNADDRARLEDFINQQNNPIQGGVHNSIDELYNVTGYDRGNDASIALGDGSWGVKNELDTYRSMVNNGEIKDGDVALLTNSRHGAKAGSQVFIYYKNGKFYTMNRNQAEELARQNRNLRFTGIIGAKSNPKFERTLGEYFFN